MCDGRTIIKEKVGHYEGLPHHILPYERFQEGKVTLPNLNMMGHMIQIRKNKNINLESLPKKLKVERPGVLDVMKKGIMLLSVTTKGPYTF